MEACCHDHHHATSEAGSLTELTDSVRWLRYVCLHLFSMALQVCTQSFIWMGSGVGGVEVLKFV